MRCERSPEYPQPATAKRRRDDARAPAEDHATAIPPCVMKRPPATTASVAEGLTTAEPTGGLNAMATTQSNTKPKYPHITVELVGYDGNAFTVLGRVTKAMRKHGLGDAEVKAFMTEATSGDYNNLLATAMRWVAELWPQHPLLDDEWDALSNAQMLL
jgi:hypothetical protein